MLDLSVLDVQKALRKYAEYGHDVQRHPFAVELEGKLYGGALGHRLDIGGGMNITPDHWLSSYLTQAERPLISNIQSKGYGANKNTSLTSIDASHISNVHYLTPTFGVHKADKTQASLYRSPHNYLSKMSLIDRLGFERPGIAVVPFSEDYDIHDALKAHKTTDVEATMPHGFNNEEAFAELLGHNRPYEGLVTVHHHRVDPATNQYVGTSRHIYDPYSEKLFSVPGR